MELQFISMLPIFAANYFKMEIILQILLILWLCLAPAGVLWLCRKIPLLDKIGPVLILYFLGLITGNIGIGTPGTAQIQDIISSAMVPLAIPLMLFGCTFRKSDTRSQLLAMITGLVAVVCSVILGYIIFGDKIDESEKIGGMLTGVYTGGTINLAALKAMLGVSEETYILMNSYDVIVSFSYLAFLLAIGIKMFRKMLHVDKSSKNKNEEALQVDDSSAGHSYSRLFTKSGMKEAGKLMLITIGACAVSGGIAFAVPGNAFMVVFILSLTTIGILCSFNRKIRSMDSAYDIGMYFIYIFCITVASMADFSKLDLAGGMYLLAYLLFVVFGSLFIQVIFARILKIDADTTIISSVTYINSPPFVPMIAAAMHNRNVIPAGLSIGIIGYAVGNYLGFIIYTLLSSI